MSAKLPSPTGHGLKLNIIPLDVVKQPPKYEIDFNKSHPSSSHYYDSYRRLYVIKVEQGRRFYLKLKLTANPKPTCAELYKDGKLVESTPRGTIFVGIDSMGVQVVDKMSYAGIYTIRSRNEMGYGEITFQLSVRCKFIFESECCY